MSKKLGLVVSIAVLIIGAVIIYRSDDQPTDAVPAPERTAPTPDGGERPPPGRTTQTVIKWVKNAPVQPARPDSTYDRDDWPHWRDAEDHGWTKAPNDYCDAREAALARDGHKIRADPDTCTITAGTWTDPYTGQTITDPGEIDIDHSVPLAAAHRAGADQWSEERRTRYANHPRVVVAVSDDANRSKGDQEPDQWRPTNRDSWCAYGRRWAVIKHHWHLAYVSQAEKTATLDLLGTC